MIYIVLALGLILRLVSLNQSLWLDEATSAIVAKMSLTQMFTRFLPGDFHPPLYYLFLKYWSVVFGYSEIALRLPSVIFGIATVYTTYLIAKKILNSKTALTASVLLAASGLAVYYSQEARMYSLAALLVSISAYLFLEKKWLLFSTALLLVGMTDYVSLFIVPVFVIIDWKDIRKVVLSFIPLTVVFLFWLPIFIRQIAGGLTVQGSAWWNILGQPTFKNAALIPVKFILGRINFDNKWLYAAVVVAVVGLFGYLLLKARQANKILWMWLFVPLIIGVLISFKVPTLTYFRFLFCLPAFYLLVAFGVEKTGKYKKLLLASVITVNVLSTSFYVLTPRFQREDWRAAAITLGSEKIVFPANSQKEALIYYGKGSQIINVSNLEPSEKEFWLSRYIWEIVDPGDNARHKIEILGYNMVSQNNFNGVLLWKYTKNQYARRD